MKKFVIHLFIFCSPILIGLILLDGYVSNLLKQSNSFAVKEYPTWNSIFSGKINSDAVICGNSRAWQHISPKILGEKLPMTFYNLGIDGHGFDLQLFRYNQLLKYNKKPRVIIQVIDVFTFEEQKDLYNSNQFLPYMLWNKDLQKKLLNYNGFHFLDFKIPLIRYYGNSPAINLVYDLFKGVEKNAKERISGYQGLEYPTDLNLNNLRKLRYKAKLDYRLIELFNLYLKKNKEENIQVILVNTPEFIEGQKCVVNRSSIIKLYAKYAKKYNIPFYDYSKDSISFKSELFYNSMHLNKKGAEIFSNKLAKKLKEDNLIKISVK